MLYQADSLLQRIHWLGRQGKSSEYLPSVDLWAGGADGEVGKT